MKYIMIFGAVLLLALYACGTTSNTTQNSCLNDKMSGMALRWGGHNYKTNNISGYQIDHKADIYSFEMKGPESEIKTKILGKVDIDRYCGLLKDTKKYFVEIQALHAPGDTSNFVEFINPASNTSLRAVWNARHKTYGSKEFRALFDSLNIFVHIIEKEFPAKKYDPR